MIRNASGAAAPVPPVPAAPSKQEKELTELMDFLQTAGLEMYHGPLVDNGFRDLRSLEVNASFQYSCPALFLWCHRTHINFPPFEQNRESLDDETLANVIGMPKV